jgi:hypothetical protein
MVFQGLMTLIHEENNSMISDGLKPSSRCKVGRSISRKFVASASGSWRPHLWKFYPQATESFFGKMGPGY